MRNSGTWATEVEIYSAALMLNTRICVYRNVVGQSAWHTHDPRLIAPLTHVSSQCIFINHINNNHYEIVTDVHLPSDGPVLSCQHQQVHVPVLAAAECEGAERPLVSHTTVTLVNRRNAMHKLRQNQEYKQKESAENRQRKAAKKPPTMVKIESMRSINSINMNEFVVDVADGLTPTMSLPNLNQHLGKVLDKHAPVRQREVRQRKPTPWYSSVADQLKELKRERRRAERRWRSSPLTINMQMYDAVKQKVTDLVHNAKTSFYSAMVSSSATCKQLFNNMTTLLGTRSVLGPVLFIMYTTPLTTLIENHCVLHEIFADDTQINHSASHDKYPDLVLSLQDLRKSVLPNLDVRNGLELPAIPSTLEGLTTLEERCISPRIPFMQMRELGCDHQFGIRGNVVNVPVDVPAMVTSLPRRFEETETIALKLKRRLPYKSSYHFENVSPGKICAAAEWLIGNSVLFREEGIKLDPSWFKPEWEGAESVEFRINSADDDSCIQGEKTNHAHSCDGGKQPECDAVSVKQCSNVPPQGPEHLVTDQASSGTVKDNNKPEQDQDGNLQEEYADLFKEWPEENIPANDKDNTGEDDEDKEWVETSQEAELGGGCRDTLLHPNDFTTDGQAALNIAPGEGKHPLGLFMDKYCEEKSFPTIFCGQRRINSDRMKPLTFSKICKAELRSADRRAAHSIANIFFKLKKLQMLQIRDLATTALRKMKGAKTGHTAGQLRKDGAIEDLLRQDQGYRVLKTLRSSPPYWQAKQKDLFAMIRQLGRPTFFATFSAAETRWLDLLRVLYRMEHSVDPTDDDLENLTWQEKSQLIQKDPVTCARYFDYRVQVLFRKVILSDLQLLGKVTDHFFRVEFQQRGSPHIHCMIWVEDAPKADTDSDEDVVAFLDKHLTCQRHEEGELKNVSSLHEHKHSKSCKKGGKHVCRFGLPLPPMSNTMMLRPLTQSEAKENSGITENLRTIKRELSQLKLGENISFEEFLARVGIDENQYIFALRSDLDSTKIFLQREPSATRMNSRNDILAQLWMANTDVQFVLDEYACGMYIVTYISKSQRGMSYLLKHADDEATRGNHSVKQKVRHIANKFLNHCEVSAQEAVYLLMQLPLTRCTRDVIFVNTSPSCQRVGLLKNSTMLEAMKDEDTDVTLTSLIDRYSERPKELENICLADFATSYDVRKAGSSSRTGKNTKKKEQDFLPEGEYEEDATDNIWNNDSSSGHLYTLSDGKVLHHRRKPKVLRCVRFPLESDSENHYREKLMYIPWRNEDKDIIGGCGTYHERFEQMKETVFEVSKQAVEQVQKDGIDEEAWDGVAPQAQDMESRHEKYNTESTINAAFQPDSEQHRQYDIGLDLGCHATSDITHDRIVNRIPNEEFDAMVRSLNCSQQTFFYHILHWMKTKCSGSLSACEPFHCFLSGGAGVGKSRCVLAIYHALVRYLSSRPGDNPDCLRVLLAAPTGKAAYNIRGVTLHTAFCLPANQSLSDYVKLDASRLNTLRSTLAELRLVIIDEMSMVGANMMGFVSQRLQQLMGCSKPFGGVSVLAVGDLFQLRPVMDRWVFQPSRGPYEALAPIVWQELFQMFELTQVMRQKDDRTFAEALNRIREGCHTKEDASLITSRVVKSSIPDNMLHLFTSRRLVTDQNTKSLALLQSSEILLEAKDSVMGDISVALKTKILHKARDMTVQQTQSSITLDSQSGR
ncbi:uncharacterized protein [Littorina saxatilis]|uniref:uncharacterized protein n=1 Tax=Littorina saxatilis TaxID=31220 RepID=UPI0038B6A967